MVKDKLVGPRPPFLNGYLVTGLYPLNLYTPKLSQMLSNDLLCKVGMAPYSHGGISGTERSDLAKG